MLATLRTLLWTSPLPFLAGLLICYSSAAEPETLGPKRDSYWAVEDVRPGMKGQGKTVMKGTKIESFDAEVLGILKNSSPGRDLIICRLSGLDLERTGVIAGMSGSPIYIEGKLLGAVAFAWPYGKDPIAGVTPFSQMHGFVEAFEKRDLAENGGQRKLGLRTPLKIGSQSFESVTVAAGDAPEKSDDSLWMVPLRTPVAASGFTEHSLSLLRDRLKGTGLVPVQGGTATAKLAEDAKDVPLQPGGPLAVSLIQGDFDLSGIGTVTHIEGNRVYGWGHPFMSMGDCELPLQTGFIHTVFPRLTVSFKMGSPVKTVGVINADVSTGIAGWLDKKPDLMPMTMTLLRGSDAKPQVFNVQTVRQKQLLPSLVFTALTNAVDMEGDLPDEMTAVMEVRIEIEGQEPLIIKDTFSGSSYSGGRAPQSLYGQVANAVSQIVGNPYTTVRVNRIDCKTTIVEGRLTADIEAVELNSDVYAPGETIKATVFVRPFKGGTERVPVSLKLPIDLPDGNYSVTICDDLTCARQEVRDNPTLNYPRNLNQILESLRVQTGGKRTALAMRVPVPGSGVAIDGKTLPSLPPSMVTVMGSTRRTGAQTTTTAVVSRRQTEYVVNGTETVKFVVSKTRTALKD
jgi:hypothetical protein